MYVCMYYRCICCHIINVCEGYLYVFGGVVIVGRVPLTSDLARPRLGVSLYTVYVYSRSIYVKCKY